MREAGTIGNNYNYSEQNLRKLKSLFNCYPTEKVNWFSYSLSSANHSVIINNLKLEHRLGLGKTTSEMYLGRIIVFKLRTTSFCKVIRNIFSLPGI